MLALDHTQGTLAMEPKKWAKQIYLITTAPLHYVRSSQFVVVVDTRIASQTLISGIDKLRNCIYRMLGDRGLLSKPPDSLTS